MRTTLHSIAIAIACAAVLAFGSAALAIDPAHDVQGNGAPVPPQSPLPPLSLSDDQRAEVSRAVAVDHTAASIAKNKAATAFEPAVGARLPAGVGLNPLPRPLVYRIPVLKQYTYVKFKHRVLIVNGLTRTIVDMLPET
jgi:hypothetical protein